MLKKVCVVVMALLTLSETVFGRFANAEKWVDSLMNKLTYEEKLGQLFVIAAYSDRSQQYQESLQKMIIDHNIGGLVFIQGNPVSQVNFTNYLQQSAKVPLLIAMNNESGPGSSLKGVNNFPEPLTLGAIQDTRHLYNYGAELARQYRILGVHMHLGLGVDIYTGPVSPSGMASIGQNTNEVARKAVALMEGLQDNGIAVAARSFPGIGASVYDTRNPFPVLNNSLDQNEDLYPFQQLINREISGIMTSNTFIPASNELASLSGLVVNNILKDKMGYQGLVISDALNLQGFTRKYEAGEVELKALRAGNDLLLFPKDISAAIQKIKIATEQGVLPTAEVEKKVKKILQLKYNAGLAVKPKVSTDNLERKLNAPESQVIRQTLYEQAVTVVKNDNDLLPIRNLDNNHIATLSIGSSQTIFQEMTTKYASLSHYDYEKDNPELLQKLARYDIVLVGLDQLTVWRDDGYGIEPATLEWLRQLNHSTKVVLFLFGSPLALDYFDDFPALIAGYENQPIPTSIAVQIAFGALPAQGRLPVSIGSQFEAGSGFDTSYLGRLAFSPAETVGMDSRVLETIDDIANEMIRSEAAPGCQVLVARKGKVVFEKSYGYFTYDSLEAVTNESVYDIASVSKVAGTLQAVMFLADRDMIDLDERIGTYLPELAGTNKESLQIRDIMTHQAGLVPTLLHWRNTVDDFGLLNDYYDIFPNEKHPLEVASGIYASTGLRDSIWNWTLRSELRRKYSRKTKYDYKYSDLGFYVLHHLVERFVNQGMDQFLKQNLYDPLGLNTLTYRPLCQYSLDRIAPTEDDHYFRNQLVRGMVHDPGAAMYGGIAGHAGLFSNAFDLGVLMQMNLQGGYYGGDHYYTPNTLQEFTSQQFEENRRGLGWDKPSYNEDYEVTSHYASPATFGHTGFTGTAVWVDPHFDLVYVFLSNRVYPKASNVKLIKNNIRTRIHNKIYEAIFNVEKYEAYQTSCY